MKRISVVIPVYNVEAYLEKCVASVLRQTYENLEIILVDDGATDSSPDICDRYARTDARVRVIHKHNGGLSEARNCGIDMAKGEYIGFVDGDDWIAPDMYARLCAACEENDADIAACGYLEVDGNRVIQHSICTGTQVFSRQEALLEILGGNTMQNFAVNKLYKTTLFRDSGLRYPVGHNMEDLATTYQLFLLANRVAAVETAFYYYVINRPGSILGNLSLATLFDTYRFHGERYTLAARYPAMEPTLFAYRVTSGQRFLQECQGRENRGRFAREIAEIKDFLAANRQKIRENERIRAYDKLFEPLYRICPALPAAAQTCVARLKRTPLRPLYSRVHRLLRARRCAGRYKIDAGAQKRIVLFGVPEHNNLGDHAIAMAERRFFERYFPDRKLIVVTETEMGDALTALQKQIRRGDIIALTGGGDIGNVYRYIEDARRRVIQAFPHNRIVIFPQTAYFSEDAAGQRELRKSARIYQAHGDLHIFAREQASYQMMKRVFAKNSVEFCPDIVLSCDATNPPAQRRGALVCLRSDLESRLNVDDGLRIRRACRQIFGRVDTTDTARYEAVPYAQQEAKIREKIEQFNSHRVVVTDRLHGVIFAAVTGTPCVALGNYNHKVKGICELLKPLSYIFYAESPEEMERLLRVSERQGPQQYNAAMFDEDYRRLRAAFEEGTIGGGD